MSRQEQQLEVRLDVLALCLAGFINTFLALFVAGVLLAPGTRNGQADLLLRAEWISENRLLWQGGWLFWFAVTLSFAWSYFALGRHLNRKRPYVSLAIGLAIIAAAVDIVGVIINLVVLPELADVILSNDANTSVQITFHAMESLSHALVNIAAFGLYSFAGLLLLPAIFATDHYPKGLSWLGATEWIIAFLATILLVIAPQVATIPLLVSFILYAPWVWGSAFWLHQNHSAQHL